MRITIIGTTKILVPGALLAAATLAPSPTLAKAAPKAKASKRVANGVCNRAELNLKVVASTGQQLQCQRNGASYRWRVLTAAAQPAATAPSAVTPATSGSLTVNKAVYIAGTKLEVLTAAVEGAEIVITGRITNENYTDEITDDHLSRTPLLIEDSTGARAELSPNTFPKTPVGGFSPIVWRARQPSPPIALNGARIVVGKSDNNQSFLPLTTGELKTFVQKTGFGVGSVIDAPHTRLEITEGRLRSTYRDSLKGQYSLALKIKATNKKEIVGQIVGAGEFVVTGPQGNRYAARNCCEGKGFGAIVCCGNQSEGWLLFDIAETSGSFTLNYDFAKLPEFGEKGSVAFTIP